MTPPCAKGIPSEGVGGKPSYPLPITYYFKVFGIKFGVKVLIFILRYSLKK